MSNPPSPEPQRPSCGRACPLRAHWYVGPVCVMLIVLAILLGHSGISPTSDNVSSIPEPVLHPYTGPESVPAVGAWPCFRGNAACTGVAESSLPRTLHVAWRKDLEGPISSTAAVVDGRVYVGTEWAGLYALALDSGEILWHCREAGTITSSPHVVGNRVLVGSYEGDFRAFDAATGEVLWSFQAEQPIQSPAAVVGDRVIFGSYDRRVYCLAIEDGAELWDYEVATEVFCCPVVSGRDVTVLSCGNGTIYTLDAEVGGPALEIATGQIALATPARVGAYLVAPTYMGTVLCMDLNSDDTRWVFDVGNQAVVFHSSPAVTGKRVVFGGRDMRLRCLDFDSGEELWQFRARDSIDSSPVIVGDRVFVGSDDGNLYAVALETGKLLWRYVGGEPISASPAVAYGRLVIGNSGGVLVCFAAKP